MSILIWIVCVVAVLFGAIVFFGAPYVPSLQVHVGNAFRSLYPVSATDVVVDLGAGDGRVLRTAIARGARGYGVELNPLLALIAQLRLGGRGNVTCANMWQYRLPGDVTLVYVFAVSRDIPRLERYLQKEVDRIGRPLSIMTFGAKLTAYKSVGELKAHSLYEIAPRQLKKHKV